MEVKDMKPKQKAKLLKSVSKVLTDNRKVGTFVTIENQSIRVLELLLKSIV